jgi:glycosyltransferase involved in cell wall biosynthesis
MKGTNFSKKDFLNRPKKKILFLSTLTPPYYGASMSSEMCLSILEEDKSFEVKNIKLNYSEGIEDVGKISFKKIYGLFQVSRQIKLLLKNFNPDIIYFAPAVTGFGLIRDYYFLRIIKIKKRGKLILHIRGQFKKKDWNNPIKKKIITQLLICDKAIVLGSELIRNLKNSVKDENIYILPNAIVDTLKSAEFEKISIEKKLNNKLNLLFLSNMQEAKGWFKVLEACKLLYSSGIKFECHFVGKWTSTTDEQKFYNFVNQHGISNMIKYHGQLLNEEKNKILSETDIFIYPTEYDACPRVIIEAMEYGITIISNNEGTIPSLIAHNETGYIVENNTVNEIYQYIIKLLDKTLRYNMSIRSRERFLEKFTINTYRKKFIDIFNNN